MGTGLRQGPGVQSDLRERSEYPGRRRLSKAAAHTLMGIYVVKTSDGHVVRRSHLLSGRSLTKRIKTSDGHVVRRSHQLSGRSLTRRIAGPALSRFRFGCRLLLSTLGIPPASSWRPTFRREICCVVSKRSLESIPSVNAKG